MSSLSLPIWRHADLLVLGSSTAAVSAALAARRSGLRVVLAGDENFVGQDLAGALHLWGTGSPDPLVEECIAAGGQAPARPAALKRCLEQKLMGAAIPFLYGVRPVSLLYGSGGLVRGAVMASRTTLFCITAGQVLDATPFGQALRLDGAPLARRRVLPDVRWRVLAQSSPAGWPGKVSHIGTYRQTLKSGPAEYEAFELSLPGEQAPADARELSHVLRASLLDEAVLYAATNLIDAGCECLADADPVASPDICDPSHLRRESGLWHVTRLLPATDPAWLTDPSLMSTLGSRTGAAAAQAAPPSGEPADSHLVTGGSPGVTFSFCEAFLRCPEGRLEVSGLSFPDWGECDVVVAGGGTGGAPAAIAAARSGVRTICLETSHSLGGVGTTGLISSYWFGNRTGFTTELDETVSGADPLSRSKRGNMWRPEIKSAVYHRLLRDAGGTAWTDSFAFGVRVSGNRPDAVLVSTPFGSGLLRAKAFIDATGNADLAASCGARVRVMGGGHAAVQGTGISPRVHPAVPHQNSDHTFIDDNDPEGITAAHVQTREKYPHDFETVPFVNSRERRQIEGEYEVSPLDILAGRTFPDTVFTARSNFDTHGFIVHPVFMVVPPDHEPLLAHVPLRCMIPKGIEGVLVTGLGMSAHRDALPVIRMQADVQNQGYAAGLLAAQVSQSGEPLRAIDVKAFQRRLVEAGILSESTALHSDSFPLPAGAVSDAALGSLGTARDVAVLFANPAQARRELAPALLRESGDGRRERAALILGLMGFPEAGPLLCELLRNATWDEGWNYRGMGQFGASMSRIDALVIALGRTRDPGAAAATARLADALDASAAFSHCRAVALAASSLRSPDLAASLKRLLGEPGFRGHAFLELKDVLADSDESPTSTRSRNLALRELYTARGLFDSGDPGGEGRAILEEYANDLRGHFALHARAVLSGGHAVDGFPA